MRQVYHFFHDNERIMTYVVMEDIVLGPKGSGRARHVVFKGCRAPLDFVSVVALERYFNKVYPPDSVCFPLLTHNFSFFLARLLRSSACGSQLALPTSALSMSR